MVAFYVLRIERGACTLDKVPAPIREEVKAAYNEAHPDAPLD